MFLQLVSSFFSTSVSRFNIFSIYFAGSRTHTKNIFIKRTPHMDLVEDFVYDMKSQNIEFHSDEEVLDYLDNAISDSLVRQAFCDFKRNYNAWLRRRK